MDFVKSVASDMFSESSELEMFADTINRKDKSNDTRKRSPNKLSCREQQMVIS